MLRNVSTVVLALGAVAITLFDLALVGPSAIGAGDEMAETPRPLTIPAEAFLTGAVKSSATVEGLQVEVVPADAGRYRVRLTNPGSDLRKVAFRIDTYETSGMMMSRMGPMRTQVATEQIIASVPAKGSVERTLAYATPQPSRDDRNRASGELTLVGLEEFRTTEFAIVPEVEGEGISPEVAMLRVAEVR